MRRWRLRISLLSPAALVLFVSTVAVPRAALVIHSDAGGEHAHSHGDDLDASSHLHQHEPACHHDHVDTYPHGLALEDDDDDHAGLHSHWQHPFHNVAPGAAPVLVVARRAESLPFAPRLDLVHALTLSQQARGPPPSVSI